MLKALIVEDELLARAGLHSLVDWEKLGYELLEDAKDGETALTVIRKFRPHVVFLDINIPCISGLELMTRLHEEGISCKIVVISSYEDYKTVRAALKLGAVDYISKLSLKKDELSNLLQTLNSETERKLSGEDVPGAAESKRGIPAGLGEEFSRGWCMAVPFDPAGGNNSGEKILTSLCEQYLSGRGLVSRGTASGGCLMFLVSCGGPDKKTAEAVRDQIYQILRKPVWIGVSGPWKNPAEREQALNYAKQIETVKFYSPEPGCHIFAEPLPEKQIADMPMAALYRRLETSLGEMKQNSVENAVNQFFELIKGRLSAGDGCPPHPGRCSGDLFPEGPGTGNKHRQYLCYGKQPALPVRHGRGKPGSPAAMVSCLYQELYGRSGRLRKGALFPGFNQNP
jgi:CheY-like chemotaxis protein